MRLLVNTTSILYMMTKVSSHVLPTATLFTKLRAATAAQHAALEARIDPLRQFQDRRSYTDYLARACPLYHAVEAELAKQDWTAISLDFEERRKAHLIEQDLAALHAQSVGGILVVPHFRDLPTAIGAMYVLEGATLGGQVIHRYLKTLDLEPGQGAAFFNGYGPRTGAMWKAFQDSASRGVHSGADTDAAVAGAVAMFELFGKWMAA